MQKSKKQNKHSYNKIAKVLKLNKIKKKKVTFKPNLMKKLKLTVSESGSSGAIIGGAIFGVVFVSILVVIIVQIKRGKPFFGKLGRGLGRGRR